MVGATVSEAGDSGVVPAPSAGKNLSFLRGDATWALPKTVIASTASPFKFNQSVLIALEGLSSVAGKNEFELLELLAQKSNMRIPKSLAELRTKAHLFDISCDKKQMQQVVSEFLKVE